MDHDDDEDRGLLDDAASKTSPRHERDEELTGVRELFTGTAKWTTLAILVMGAVIALPLLGYVSRGALPGAMSHDETQMATQMAIALHPKLHNARKATTLTFDWNITLGTRSPDGVEKQVYLVNGKCMRNEALEW